MIVSDWCTSFQTIGIGSTLSAIKSNHHHVFIETYYSQRTSLLGDGARIAKPEFLTSKSFPTHLEVGVVCDIHVGKCKSKAMHHHSELVSGNLGVPVHICQWLSGDTFVLAALGLRFSHCK